AGRWEAPTSPPALTQSKDVSHASSYNPHYTRVRAPRKFNPRRRSQPRAPGGRGHPHPAAAPPLGWLRPGRERTLMAGSLVQLRHPLGEKVKIALWLARGDLQYMAEDCLNHALAAHCQHVRIVN